MVGHVLIEIERAAEVGRAQRQKTYGVPCLERRVVRCHRATHRSKVSLAAAGSKGAPACAAASLCARLHDMN